MFKCAGCGRAVDAEHWKKVSHLCLVCIDDVTGSSKRKYVRLSVGREVEYSLVQKTETGRVDTATKNISAVGLCIIAFEKLEPGDTLDLKVSIPRFVLLKRRGRRVIEAKGKVVWVDALKIEGRKIEKAYQMGVELTKIDKKDQEKIKKYVESKIARSKAFFRNRQKPAAQE